MARQEITMSMRDAYLETVRSQLKEFETEIDGLKAEGHSIRPNANYAFYHQIHGLSAKLDTVQQKLQDLSLAGKEEWEGVQADLDNSFATLKQELDQVKAVAKQARYEVLSWGRGIAKEHLVTSIGWAEGIAKEDVITSIGWAEGYGKEKEKA